MVRWACSQALCYACMCGLFNSHRRRHVMVLHSFEAACQAAWTSEHSGAEPLPLPGARAEAGETAVDGGAGEEESKGEQKLEGLSDLTRSRMNENDKRIRLNVGGQLFETTAEVLRREPDSLLAALTFSEPPAEADESGVFFFDRDWYVQLHCIALHCNAKGFGVGS